LGISEKTAKLIWGEFAGRCAICHEELIHENQSEKKTLLGEVAHIVGERERAARGIHDMAIESRNEPDNLLLLCRPHHKLIDDDGALYTIEELRRIKREFLDWLKLRLAKAKPWDTNISQYCYINIPRLGELGILSGKNIDLNKYKDLNNLHSQGMRINEVLFAFEEVMPQLNVSAVPLESLEYNHEGYIGQLISFDRARFRTKNNPGNAAEAENCMPDPCPDTVAEPPQIYKQFKGWKLVLLIDPRWITTATAFVLFKGSGGQSTFSGVARISNVDFENNKMLGTPLIIGIPKGPLDNWFAK
jgi:HNH endonuclease